jgi:uncharacterized protein (DUF4415 family)
MTRVTRGQANEIRTLQKMKDEEIDFTDIPLITDWSKAAVGTLYRPIKKSLTIRVDADVLAWLRGQGKGYQTRINTLLRNAMESADSTRRQAGPRGRPQTAGGLANLSRKRQAAKNLAAIPRPSSGS